MKPARLGGGAAGGGGAIIGFGSSEKAFCPGGSVEASGTVSVPVGRPGASMEAGCSGAVVNPGAGWTSAGVAGASVADGGAVSPVSVDGA